MMIFPPHLLESFVAVADAQSYTKGGAHIQLAQPTVHQHVRQLERLTKTRLVEQSGKKVLLTAHGRLLYEHALRVRELSEEFERALEDDRSLVKGELALAAATTAGDFIVPRICTAFHRRFPGVRTSVSVINNGAEVDRDVTERRYELGFHSNGNQEPGLTKTPVISETLVGIAPPGHRFVNNGGPVSASEFTGEPFVMFGGNLSPVLGRPAPRPTIGVLIDDWLQAGCAVPQVTFSTTSLEGIKTAVRARAGVAIVSRASVRDDDVSLAAFELVEPPRRSFFMVHRASGWESAAHRAFVEFVLSRAWEE